MEEQGEDPDSALTFSREMIALRKATPALTLGDIEFLGTAEPIVAFVRRHEGEEVVCVFNFSDAPQVFAHPSLGDVGLLPLRNGERRRCAAAPSACSPYRRVLPAAST